ncbi:protein STICHEL-like 3 isoform X2 [Diospyros lotus]|uniref:protein STICHEL-like 3 isoform X2 n=1 Tax=Diospyros lotus TaxID=55363 RepID=UPI00225BDEF5|nr:protein STICHEL-like 3 isoform X2 [Diospyros lotus]
MSTVVCDRILKDANGGISDHLSNHVHLANCIHLKNHMHKHSPLLADKLLMRDLHVLQRSRPLRDPSASPHSSYSTSAVDLLSKRDEKYAMVQNGGQSVGVEHQNDGRKMSVCSPIVASSSSAEVGHGEASRHNDGAAPVSDDGISKRVRENRRINGYGSKWNLVTGGNDQHPQDQDDNSLIQDIVSGNSEPKDETAEEQGRHQKDGSLKSLCEQLNNVPAYSDDAASSHVHRHGKREEAEASIHGRHGGFNRVKRFKFRGTTRTRKPSNFGAKNEMSVASNSLAQSSARPKHGMEEGEEGYDEQTVTRVPRNGCGIPWNWSRIHHRGRSFLDMAGRSLSCGLSDSKLIKGGSIPQGRDAADMPILSGLSSSYTESDTETLPLLMEASGSVGSTDNADWIHDYSGELGIYVDNLLNCEIDSDLASEARSGDQHKFRRHHKNRHQNLTQKYMPRTFRDLVGQNLVAQALSNAVAKRKVGLLYVFYGPHGTGKTSCARIFSRALNCQSLEQPRPCGICHSCIASDKGKSRNIREVGSLSNFDFKNIMDLLDNMILSHLPSQYRVFIFDDCDTLSPDGWNAISKVIDRAPRRVVFVLVSSSLHVLPHIIISRCQKFFFPKLKDADIVYALQRITTKEGLEIDKDALKLIASRSDGSLRDAEMTLEQLSLLGQRISVPLVQELVGLISDEKLVDLLDLALSADTSNTVKNLREIMGSGVEPLALMSQLATVITDILAGSYDLTKERPRRKFFRKQTLTKEDMEKLRQALKTLSEAEKQLRMSNDRLTWLTAALLQLAPDQQYMLSNSSTETTSKLSPVGQSNAGVRERPRKSSVEHVEMLNTERRLSTHDTGIENLHTGGSADVYCNNNNRKPPQAFMPSAEMERMRGRPLSDRIHMEIEEIWSKVLDRIQISSLKEFIHQEGKLISVSSGAAPTVQLMFSSRRTKSEAEKYRVHILQAFESVLGSPVTIEIRCELRKDADQVNLSLVSPGYHYGSSHMHTSTGLQSGNRMAMAGYSNNINNRHSTERDGLIQAQTLQSDSVEPRRNEIVEISYPGDPKGNGCNGNNVQYDRSNGGSAWISKAEALHKKSPTASLQEQRKFGGKNQSQSQSLVRSKVSLAHVIHQAEGSTQQNGWSKRRAISIAERLEQENLKLESRSRTLLCWKASRVTCRKLSHLKIRTRKPQTFLRFVSCGRCLQAKTPK